jgi:hypothetical protein
LGSLARNIAIAVFVAIGLAAVWLVALERREEALFDANVARILDLMPSSGGATDQERLDAVRRFIHINTRHDVSDEFWELHGDKNRIAEELIAHARGKRNEPVPLECSTRANLMGAILRKMGYETRIIAIFDTESSLRSHSFLDVRTSETGKWESQDPALDVYWRSKSSHERLSVAEAAEDLSALEPCSPWRCGWDVTSKEGLSPKRLQHYLDIITITDKESGFRQARYTSRAALSRIYSKKGRTGTFCAVIPKYCKDGLLPVSDDVTRERTPKP